MNLSDDGRARIEGYEGYHDRMPDGSCRAYQKTYNGKKDKWTIGFGCTEGVYEGLIWTREQADAAFSKELAKFESAVTRLVTVDLNQNQYDALVSFCYNVGLGAGKIPGFSNSTLLKKLNKGDYKGAADQFQYWNHVNGRPVSGLTQRRTSEANLFLKPTAPEPAPAMPQTVSKSREPLGEKAAATVGTGITLGAQTLLSAATPKPQLPSIADLDKIVSTGQHIRTTLANAGELGMFLLGPFTSPLTLALLFVGLFCIWRVSGIGSSKGNSNDQAAQSD